MQKVATYWKGDVFSGRESHSHFNGVRLRVDSFREMLKQTLHEPQRPVDSERAGDDTKEEMILSVPPSQRI